MDSTLASCVTVFHAALASSLGNAYLWTTGTPPKAMTVKIVVPTSCTPLFFRTSQHAEHQSRSRPRLSSLRKTRLCFNPRGHFMTTTYDPQVAAEQSRAAYREMTDQLGKLGLDAAVPEGVRAIAEKTVAQTREACDRSLDVFDASLRRSRSPLKLPANVRWPSTAKSSISPGAMSMRASIWPRAWRTPKTSLTSCACRQPSGARDSPY